jgi:AcrR family transcriptional regulator
LEQNPDLSTDAQPASERQARALRILDAAAELILRWGYDKTTIADIARQAGVGKGTIYLHWRTRADLFRGLIMREQLAVALDSKQRISADPQGATLGGIAKHTALAAMQRPLIKALFLRDVDVLGKLADSELSSAVYAARLSGFKVYLELLRQHGLARTDLSLEAETHIWSAIFAGFFLGTTWMPEEFALSDEELAELLGETVHRALETGEPIPAETLQAVTRAFVAYMDQTTSMAVERFQHELGS